MKRRLLIIAIFLLAGAVVNVAVAWGCAWWPCSAVDLGPEDHQVLPSSRYVGWWNKHVFPLFDADIDVLWDSRDLGVEMRVFYGIDSNQRTVSAIRPGGRTWPVTVDSGQKQATGTWACGGGRYNRSASSAVELGEGQMGNVGVSAPINIRTSCHEVSRL